MSDPDVERVFPKLAADGWKKTSDATSDYNCFAFALHDQADWYSPLPIYGYYWPTDKLPRDTAISTMIELFRHEGRFEPVEDGNNEYEDGFEKIVLYVNQAGNVTHAARQVDSKTWTSKLGNLADIEHRLLSSLEDAGVTRDDYGKAIKFLKRPIPPK